MDHLLILIGIIHSFHIDYIITILTTVTVVLRMTPLGQNLKFLVWAAQGGLLLAQMYKIYKQLHPKEERQINSPTMFVAEVAQHFMETHPEGQRIADASDADEEAEHIISGEPVG